MPVSVPWGFLFIPDTFCLFSYFGFHYLKKHFFFDKESTQVTNQNIIKGDTNRAGSTLKSITKTCQSMQSERRLINLHVSITTAEFMERKQQWEKEREICLTLTLLDGVSTDPRGGLFVTFHRCFIPLFQFANLFLMCSYNCFLFLF